MQNKNVLLFCGATLMFALAAQPAFAEPKITSDSLSLLVKQAVSSDPNIAAHAIAAIRSKGAAGLNALMGANHEKIEHHKSVSGAAREIDPAWPRLCAALDGVSAQHDSYASGLYWYTDLDQAKAAARAAGKPILSLRLLGRLDEDCSCANSRFFRTTLYPNAEVSQYLRDHFVLHWKSVRPVPRITVDFGDGRKIERTVTGNSIHYILDSDGHPIDAVPGLYGPQAFLKQLQNAEREEYQLAAEKNQNEELALSRYHAQLLKTARAVLVHDMEIVSAPAATQPVKLSLGPPTAVAAGARSYGKFVVEKPLLNSFQEPDDATWARIAALHQAEASLDPTAINLIATKAPTPSASQASIITATKSAPENPLIRTIRNLQRSIAEDTVRNEYSLHARIHQWFADRTIPADLEQFNSKVYAELFLTPESDPWLGLVPTDTFTGLDNNGLVCPPK